MTLRLLFLEITCPWADIGIIGCIGRHIVIADSVRERADSLETFVDIAIHNVVMNLDAARRVKCETRASIGGDRIIDGTRRVSRGFK